MKIVDLANWRFYLGKGCEDLSYSHECGKWMIFPKTIEYAEKLCSEAVGNEIVAEAKHSINISNNGKESYLCCFYLEGSDLERHRKFIEFFRNHDFLPKKKNGNYINIAYKYDLQTKLGLYGDRFISNIHLADFIDLETGEFKEEFLIRENEELQKKQIENEISLRVAKYLNCPPMNRWGSGWLVLKEGDYLDGVFIKEEMKKQGISVSELSKKISISESSLRRWLKGNSRPYAWNAIAMCVHLNIDEHEAIHHIET